MIATLKLSGVLTLNEFAFLIQNEYVRVTIDLRVLRQDCFVLVFRAEIHFHNHVLLQQLANFSIGLEERVELVAPRSPVATHVQQDVLILLGRSLDGVGDVLCSVAGRIKNILRLSSGSCCCRSRTLAIGGSKSSRNNEDRE